ncbi:MAG: (2Fe-2S) ferredoxin domain-containing protein [Caldilineales bacterium]|nr:(2Fe-2S) ferredoxin domain-containing protein [Caldilineales bacterium]
MEDAPIQAPYSRHVFFCVGQHCDPDGRAGALYQRLLPMLGEFGQYDNPDRIKRGVTACLGVCYGGPLMVVYPEGIWYHNLDEYKLARIVEEHLKGGQPVEEYIFHRLGDHSPNGTGW